MRLIGIMPVRNEAWILGFSLRVALKWCDAVIVLAHACTDESEGIIADAAAEHPGMVSMYTDRAGAWSEMEHRHGLLERARDWQGSHIALIDADEVITANLLPDVRSMVACLRRDSMLDLPLYNLRMAFHNYHANGVWGNRWVATGFLDRPELHWAGDGFHHREPFGVARWNRVQPVAQGAGGVLHFWGASERRLRAKHALYKITERLRFPQKPVAEIEAYYSQAMRPMPEKIRDQHGRVIRERPAQPWTFAAVNPEWWLHGYEDLMAEYLHIDAEPWQEAECQRLYQQYGAERFIGLDLLGVVE